MIDMNLSTAISLRSLTITTSLPSLFSNDTTERGGEYGRLMGQGCGTAWPR